MATHFNELIKHIKDIRMTDAEKQTTRAHILAFLSAHPSPEPHTVFAFAAFFRKPVVVFGSIALVLVTGGGVSLAAEGALPGDLLYPVKVRVNEEVRAAVLVSSEAKAGWEARRLERRLEEAESLAVAKVFDRDVRERVEVELEKHSQNVGNRIVALEAEGKVEAAAKLNSTMESSFRAHERILVGIASSTPKEENDDLSPFIVRVQEKKRGATQARSQAEARVATGADASLQAAASERLSIVTKKIDEFERALEKKKSALDPKLYLQIKARLDAAKKAALTGKGHLDAGAAAKAFASLQQAHRGVEELHALLEAQTRLSVSVKIDAAVGENEDELEKPDDDENGHKEDDEDQGERKAAIHTRQGDLLLRYENNGAALSGTLGRSTPCVTWKGGVTSTKDLPPSEVIFTLTQESTATICIQVLGKPQEISLRAPAGPRTRYTVRVNGETVFSKMLDAATGADPLSDDDVPEAEVPEDESVDAEESGEGGKPE